jgi:type IV pilus assembly protein PilO
MADILEQLQKTTRSQKLIALVLLVACLGAVYYFLFWTDFEVQGKRMQSEYARLDEELRSYEGRKRDYMRFKNEVAKLLEDQKELLRILPKKAELPTFLDSIYNQAEPLGLEINLFARKDEKPQELYVRIPVDIELFGSFHQIARFFNKVAGLPRIVNIEDVTLADPTVTDSGVRLKAKFQAVTFRFADRPQPAGPPKKG